MENTHPVIGDSVVVRPGVTEKGTGRDLGGWQGRIVELASRRDQLIVEWVIVAWDSLTLKNILPADIARCEEWGASWLGVRLAVQDVRPSIDRDEEEDVQAAIAALRSAYSWLSLGEEGRRIREIVDPAKGHDVFVGYAAWHEYLKAHMAMPFVATVREVGDASPVRQGARVKVTGISLVDDTWGIIVQGELPSLDPELPGVYHFPLSRLSTDDCAETEQLIRDYALWFVNHSHVYAHYPP